MKEDPIYLEALTTFSEWLDQAREVVEEAGAMVLATAEPGGRISARTVLLKHHDPRGLVFYSHRSSDKGEQISADPRAAVCFFWKPINKQVRFEGRVESVSDRTADDYFAGRPRASQIGAWASDQSRPLTNRSQLDAKVNAMEQRFEGGPVPRPPFWVGYRLVPDLIEFWQGHPTRLHDRWRYVPSNVGWIRTLLNP